MQEGSDLTYYGRPHGSSMTVVNVADDESLID